VSDKEYNQYDGLHLDMDVDEHMDYQVNQLFVHYYQQLDQKYPKKFSFLKVLSLFFFTLLIR
jgi:hypothetical protein